jgi:hypothetical protein
MKTVVLYNKSNAQSIGAAIITWQKFIDSKVIDISEIDESLKKINNFELLVICEKVDNKIVKSFEKKLIKTDLSEQFKKEFKLKKLILDFTSDEKYSINAWNQFYKSKFIPVIFSNLNPPVVNGEIKKDKIKKAEITGLLINIFLNDLKNPEILADWESLIDKESDINDPTRKSVGQNVILLANLSQLAERVKKVIEFNF